MQPMQNAISEADSVYRQINNITLLLDTFNTRHAVLLHEALQEQSCSTSNVEPTSNCLSKARRRALVIPALPREIIHLIFSFVGRKADLFSSALASKTLHFMATSAIYRNIFLEKPLESIRCLQALSRNHRLALCVRSFDIHWNWKKPTGNLYRLLHCVLQRMTSLSSLSIEVHSDFNSHILRDCTFSLTRFSSSFRCDSSLVEFLEKQFSITELTLRGFNSDPSDFSFNSNSFNLNPNPTPFPISGEALPKLSRLRAIHAGHEVISRIISGRPLTQVSMPLYADCVKKSLDALELSTERISRLNVISFDPYAPDYLLEEISKRLPDLEALHIVILLAQCSEVIYPLPVLLLDLRWECGQAALVDSAPYLRNFKSLQYLTYMSATSLGSISQETEAKIASEWHKSCPTLKTIILPMGKVWFYDNTKWSCLGEQEES
ncbi:hypothetical protein D9758_010506 [Tetrapyrgos nigripes]|uniref:F-box domain-containing protein n=1 Tax=Tetrapyrgos nigripes TaxID=182062 RepID=A0A8H5CZJ1_9AGAR|nr:hypothetical protein D9758_010506 [Tetrapyrgos nigripes]